MNSALLIKLMAAEVRQLVDPMRERISQLEAQVRAAAAVPAPVSVVSASIDRSGHLLLAQSNGVMLDVGPVVGKDFDPSILPDVIAQALADAPTPAPPSIDSEAVAQVVQDAIAAMPTPKDGKDADPDVVRSMIQEAIAQVPTPKDGKDADPEVIRSMVADAVAQVPAPKDGKDVDPEVIRSMVADAVAQVPAPRDGKDADLEVVRSMVKAAVDDCLPVLEEAIAKSVKALPTPAAPIGLGSAVINQAGHLLLTMTDGTERDLGEVVGKSVDIDALHQVVHRMVAQIPAPKDGRDGIATRDELLTLVSDSVATAVAPEVEAQVAKAITTVPRIEYHGVWTERAFSVGDAVTFGGSLWICRTPGTLDKPGTSDAWQLAVKKGRDGKGS